MDRLTFTKNGVETSWLDPIAFPTVETNEATVRADIQLFFDEIQTVLNGAIDELSSTGAAAALPITPITGMTATTVQGAIEELHSAFGSYATKAEVQTALSSYATKAEVQTALSVYATQSYVQAEIASAIGDAIGGSY